MWKCQHTETGMFIIPLQKYLPWTLMFPSKYVIKGILIRPSGRFRDNSSMNVLGCYLPNFFTYLSHPDFPCNYLSTHLSRVASIHSIAPARYLSLTNHSISSLGLQCSVQGWTKELNLGWQANEFQCPSLFGKNCFTVSMGVTWLIHTFPNKLSFMMLLATSIY